MKSELYRKWLKYCKCFDGSYLGKMYYKKSHKMYASALGDKFFEKYIKYSRLWHKIKVECDLNGCKLKGIHCQDHPLHSYCPSIRLNNRRLASDFICDIDFAFMYQTVIKIPEVVVDENENITLSYKKKTV